MLRAISISREASRAIGGWVVIFFLTIMLGEAYLRHSTPAALALNFTQHSAAVQNAVGGTVHARLKWIGHIHYDGDGGWASFAVQVSGARTNGTTDLTLRRQREQWNVLTGRLRTDSGRVIEVTEPLTKINQACAEN
jgi:hypothetical protein